MGPACGLEITLQETASVNQLNFIPAYRGYIRLEMVAKESSNLH